MWKERVAAVQLARTPSAWRCGVDLLHNAGRCATRLCRRVSGVWHAVLVGGLPRPTVLSMGAFFSAIGAGGPVVVHYCGGRLYFAWHAGMEKTSGWTASARTE